ncbi:MAG: hypothetical protein HWE13_12730 [Gammaproteobacteria bacterium]|nr:hypothetical protein [Gammaproteobacteria bacterium]NVK88992.1 hypothetical protein [Gammaproteobacteria bacterium]
MKLNQIRLIGCLILLWTSVQLAAIDHVFSEQHELGATCEWCLHHHKNLDELSVAPVAFINAPAQEQPLNKPSASAIVVLPLRLLPPPRAPPTV